MGNSHPRMGGGHSWRVFSLICSNQNKNKIIKMLVLVQAAHSCGSPSSPIFLHPASASSRSKEQPSTIPGEKRAQFSPFLCLQVFCSIWPRSLGFLANSNSFCHLLSFPFSRERKNENQMVLRVLQQPAQSPVTATKFGKSGTTTGSC